MEYQPPDRARHFNHPGIPEEFPQIATQGRRGWGIRRSQIGDQYTGFFGVVMAKIGGTLVRHGSGSWK